VEIVVVQGERVMAVENTVLGRFTLDGIPPAPRGEPRIEVTFKIDANGTLQVTAQDQATGREQQITITASSGLSEEEIEHMVAEAKEHDERNRQRRQAIKTRNRADSMAYQAEKTLERYGDRLTPALRSKVRSEVAALRQALRAGEIEAVERAMQELDETTRMIAREFSVKRDEA